MSFNVGTENFIIEETNTAQLGLKLEINMFNPQKKTAMEDKKQQSCGEMDIKLKVTRRPRRFKPGSDLTDKVNLVSMEVIQETTEEQEELTFMVKLGCTKQEK